VGGRRYHDLLMTRIPKEESAPQRWQRSRRYGINHTMASAAKTYPIVFAYPEVISGKGFMARVEIQGHALLVDTPGDVWFYSVRPGVFAGGGADYSTAGREFKKSYLSILFDIAAEASSFEKFEKEVRAFFDTVNEPNLADWKVALADVRKNNTRLPQFGKVQADLWPPKIKIKNLDVRTVRPGLNRFDTVAIIQPKAA
jgi:hypothetical protein